MSEMVDRVARALCIADGYDPDANENRAWLDGDVILSDTKLGWEWHIARARAALEAMREPTDEMLQAGSLLTWDLDDPPGSGYVIARPLALGENQRTVWQRMVEETLK